VNALVVGSGAVGTLLGWALATGGIQVAIVRRSAPRTETVELRVAGPDGLRHAPGVTIVRSPSDLSSEPTIVVLALKAFDVPAALDTLADFAHGTFVTFQNGVGTEELVAERRPGNPLVAASLTASVDLGPDRVAHWLRRGGVGLASVRDDRGVAPGTIAAMFRPAGLRTRVFDDWQAMKWSKLIANLVGNATSALADMTVAEVYAHPGLFDIERQQLQEAFGVLHALGLKPVSLPGADVSRLELALGLPSPVGRTILGFAVGGGRGGKDPSLRLALAGGAEQTEVDWLNGAVVRAAGRTGVATPVNAALTELVTEAARDPSVRERLRGKPEALIDAIAAFRQEKASQPTGRISAG
jgi:2-dehydropantoate 2-reductase